LKTAESGYLTRKLCDASQEVIIREEDCGTEDSLLFTADEAMMRGTTLGKLVLGRVLAEDIEDQFGNVILKKNEFLNKENAEIIENISKEYIKIRSALTCKSVSGVCQKCFGMDLSTRQMVDIGSPIGIIAAQSIGEPATQLTMRTFHGG
jgi:DNA-directed RNA polymerase subunit beta'